MYQSKYYSTTFNLCACRVRMTELNTLVTCSRHTAWWRNKTWLTDIWSLYIRQSTWKVHRIMSWSRTLTRNLKNFRAETCILKTMWEKMQALYFVKGGIHRTLKIGLKCYDSHKALQLSLTIRAGKAWESSFMSFFFSFFLCVCMCMWGGGVIIRVFSPKETSSLHCEKKEMSTAVLTSGIKSCSLRWLCLISGLQAETGAWTQKIKWLVDPFRNNCTRHYS